jgi:hypothetical protein
MNPPIALRNGNASTSTIGSSEPVNVRLMNPFKPTVRPGPIAMNAKRTTGTDTI